MLSFSRDPKALVINISIFGAIGIIYYLYFIFKQLSEPLFHPLVYGWVGIWFSCVGILSIYQYLKYRNVILYKNSIYAAFLSVFYFLGFFLFPSFLSSSTVDIVMIVWIGILLVSYFITFGALNWYFGIYIVLFNLMVLLFTFLNNSGIDSSPVVWVSIFSFMGISNIYVQWSIVLLSTLLGLLDKGFDMFKIISE